MIDKPAVSVRELRAGTIVKQFFSHPAPAQITAGCRRDTVNGQPIPAFCTLPAPNICKVAGIASPPGCSYYPPLYCSAGA
ncbi:hypothetical protein BOTU111921_02855 [Bordetella tumbae]|uniref:hypothetical protein n=1 Tax=Bordetella tumbae TaxID=1649139 RepID=UPI0039EF9DB2